MQNKISKLFKKLLLYSYVSYRLRNLKIIISKFDITII